MSPAPDALDTSEYPSRLAPRFGRLQEVSASHRHFVYVASDGSAVRTATDALGLRHITNYATQDLFAVDMQNASNRKLTDDEIERQYRAFLQQVDAVQLEQMALLRCLIKDRGLKRIYQEGLTAGDLFDYKFMIAILKDTEETQSDHGARLRGEPVADIGSLRGGRQTYD
jgi:hypothetical protein